MPSPAFTKVARCYDALMANVPYAMWADYLEEIFDHMAATPRTVLDLATGTGTVGLLLAARGYRVNGVDISEPMLEEARRKAQEAGLAVEFVHGDVADLDVPRASFDAAVCLYDSLNYILDPQRLQRALDSVAAALAPGGLFIFDLNTIYSFEQEMFTQQNLSPGRPVRYRWVSRYDRDARVARIDMEFWTDDGDHFEETHYQRSHSVEEVADGLERAGFLVEGLYEAYTFLPPGPKSERIFYVARRTGQD
ncbi:MAG: class I SAM-dependent methyltransferase [Armatimonadota bacterium]|nr:MAG: class I SAM-dependent methyltransferase [Armatimonadota bacterium]